MSQAVDSAERGSAPAYLRHCDRLLWRLDRARIELDEILGRTEARLVQVPRRHIEQLLSWFDTLEDEVDEDCDLKSQVGHRIEALVACLDALEPDCDLEAEELESEDLGDAEEAAA